MSVGPVLLIAYDGSADARATIDHVAKLLPRAQATVLFVWEPLGPGTASNGNPTAAAPHFWGAAGAPSEADSARWDGTSEAHASAKASEGAERATRAGLQAAPRTSRSRGSTAEAILGVADELDASVIALGNCGLTGAKTYSMGSVAHAVLKQADRPVTVVPSAETAGRRAAHRHHDPVVRSRAT